MEPRELAKAAVFALRGKKGRDIQLLKVHDLTVLADYFVIASGTSTTQVSALRDEVEYQLGRAGIEPLRTEGAASKNWILLDYGAVVVHIFVPEAREYYALERLWADAQPVDVPETQA